MELLVLLFYSGGGAKLPMGLWLLILLVALYCDSMEEELLALDSPWDLCGDTGGAPHHLPTLPICLGGLFWRKFSFCDSLRTLKGSLSRGVVWGGPPNRVGRGGVLTYWYPLFFPYESPDC